MKQLTADETLRIGQGICFGIGVIFAVGSQNHWIVMASGLLAGFNLGGLIYGFFLERARHCIATMGKLCDDMTAMNHALLHDKVVMHVMGDGDGPRTSIH